MPLTVIQQARYDLAIKVSRYAAERGISLAEARRRLISLAFHHLHAHAKGGKNAAAKRTPEERSAIARRAAQARWKTPAN
jgi:hypothetical protein